MQHLRAKIGEFGSFFKTDGLDPQRLRTNARIGGHDAVDVGPDFDGVSLQAAADECRGEVRTAAAERGGCALQRGADEAAHDADLGLPG